VLRMSTKANILISLFPGFLTLYLAYSSGGVFPVTVATVSLMCIAVMLARAALASRPLAGLSKTGVAVGALLTIFAIWTLSSMSWSGSAGRALDAFDYVLLYLLVFLLFASLPRSPVATRWMLRGLLAATAIVALLGLASRLLPSFLPTRSALAEGRLSYPVTYWNTFGLIVAMGFLLALHHASDDQESVHVRLLAAALSPLLALALFLTLSRGAIAVAIGGALLYLVVARPRAALGALLAMLPAIAFILNRAYRLSSLQEGVPLTPEAIAAARGLAITALACALSAAVLRAVALPLDNWVASRRGTIGKDRRRTRAVLIGGTTALAVLAIAGLHGISWAESHYRGFLSEAHYAPAELHGRLFDVNNDGRLPIWRVALHSYDRQPLTGSGAGTFRVDWERHQDDQFDRVYAYSLYIEVLAELGLIGLVVLVAALALIVGRIVALARGSERGFFAIALAIVVGWIFQAGLDWDWQTPAATVIVFAVAGVALARTKDASYAADDRASLAGPRPYPSGLARSALRAFYRPGLVVLCAGLAVFAARTALAQRDLSGAIAALDANRCPQAVASAQSAIRTLDTGPRPYEVLAVCAAREGRPRSGVSLAREAVNSDPRNWEPYYVLALAEGFAGLDPRGAAAIAERDYPLSPYAKLARSAFRGDRRTWPQAAAALPFTFN
jgi:hypothetical protein